MVEFYLKLNPILRIITYLTYICWEIDNFVIKSDIFGRFVRIFLKNYRVTMTTALDTSCSENTMILSARRVFRMHVFSSYYENINQAVSCHIGTHKSPLCTNEKLSDLIVQRYSYSNLVWKLYTRSYMYK